MSTETQPSFEFMNEELPKESTEASEEVINMNSSEQVDGGEAGFERITKRNLDLAIENLSNGIFEKREGKLVAEKSRKEGEYTFRRWIDISKISPNLGTHDKDLTSKSNLVLAKLDEYEQRGVDYIMRGDAEIHTPVVELSNVDLADDSSGQYDDNPNKIYDRDKGTYI